MTDSFLEPGPDGALPPEVPANGLVLWRLRRDGREWWCSVADVAERLVLRVHDPNAERTALTETHDTAASVVARADELRAQFADDGWKVVEDSPLTPTAIMTLWLTAPDWTVTGVVNWTKGEPKASVVSQRPRGLLAPEHAAILRGALGAALRGYPETVYVKAIEDDGVRWRRCLMSRDDARVRLDIYEAVESEALEAVEVDLRD